MVLYTVYQVYSPLFIFLVEKYFAPDVANSSLERQKIKIPEFIRFLFFFGGGDFIPPHEKIRKFSIDRLKLFL
jgi:hypothetical protein